MLAMLLAMTSRLVCWAFMPVAAMASAFMATPSDLHAADFEIGRDDLVADRHRRLQRLLGGHHRIDHGAHIAIALQGLDRELLGLLEVVGDAAGGIAEHAGESLADPGRR